MSPVLDEYGRAPWQDRLSGARQPLSQAQQEEMALRLDPVTKAYGLPDDFGTRGEAPAAPPPAPVGQGVLGNMSPESEARFSRAFPQEGRAEYEPPDENLARMHEIASPRPLVMAREPDAPEPPRARLEDPMADREDLRRRLGPTASRRLGRDAEGNDLNAIPTDREDLIKHLGPNPSRRLGRDAAGNDLDAPSAFQQFMMERARKDDEARAKAEDDRKKQAFARGLSQIGQGLGSAFGGGGRSRGREPM